MVESNLATDVISDLKRQSVLRAEIINQILETNNLETLEQIKEFVSGLVE